jgi:hypothetical protein
LGGGAAAIFLQTPKKPHFTSLQSTGTKPQVESSVSVERGNKQATKLLFFCAPRNQEPPLGRKEQVNNQSLTQLTHSQEQGRKGGKNLEKETVACLLALFLI